LGPAIQQGIICLPLSMLIFSMLVAALNIIACAGGTQIAAILRTVLARVLGVKRQIRLDTDLTFRNPNDRRLASSST